MTSRPMADYRPAEIRPEPHPLRYGSICYRAYTPEGEPLHMGASVYRDLVILLRSFGYTVEPTVNAKEN